MGKNLIQQARGKGGPTYRAPSFRYKGKAGLKSQKDETILGKIVDLVKCPGHSTPLAAIRYTEGNGEDHFEPMAFSLGPARVSHVLETVWQ